MEEALYSELANRLEAVRKFDLEAESLAQLMHTYGITNLPLVNKMVNDLLAPLMRRMRLEAEPSENSVTSEFLVDLITPWVEDVRQELFNSRIAPFSTFDEASRWYSKGTKKDRRFVERRQKEWGKEADADAQKKVDTRTGREYEKKSPRQKWAFAYETIFENLPETATLACYFRAEEIAYATSFSSFSVLMYILVGIRPVLTKVRTYADEEVHKLPSGDNLVNRLVTVEIRGELSFEDLRSLYRSVRQELGINRAKSLKEKHLELYLMVRQKGGAPKGKGTVAFWECLTEEWNKKHKDDQYTTTWKGVKRAYDMVCKKLRSQYLTEHKRK